jgi:hypothetical protein
LSTIEQKLHDMTTFDLGRLSQSCPSLSLSLSLSRIEFMFVGCVIMELVFFFKVGDTDA